MAMKPQLIAAMVVVLTVSSATAQQYGPMNGSDGGAYPAPSSQMIYSAVQPPFSTAPPSQMGYNGAPPVFAATEMSMGQGGLQLASTAFSGPVNGPAPQNPAEAGIPSNAGANYMDPAGPMYAAGPQSGDPTMTYGPGPGMAPGYPTAPPGAAAYGAFPTPEPVTPRWYVRGEIVWLARSSPNDRNLTSYNNASSTSDPLNNRFILDTDALPFGLAPGTRITIGHYLTDRTAIEGEFYGANNWDDHAGTLAYPSTNGLGPLSSYWGTGGGPFSTSAFSNSNQQLASYQSSFNSAEVGVRQWVLPSLSVLAGFRFISVADQFQLTATNNASNIDAGQAGYYRTWTNNNLGGLQVGTEYTHDLYMRWLFFSIEGKAGAFFNFVDEKNMLFNTDTTYNQRSARETQIATMFDLSLALTALVSDHLTLRGGYTFLLLDGVALASDQLDTNPTLASSRDFLADKGAMTLQGPFVGAEIAW
jgi:hypothetical protein